MIAIKHYSYTKYRSNIRQIYESSFPLEERFNFDILRSCDREQNVHLSCILFNDNPIGMMFTVGLPNDITYLMYFAIDVRYRNQGLGSAILQKLVVSKRNILLCIEKPCDYLTSSRKNFYLANGFYETGICIEDTGVQYEFLSSRLGYVPSAEDLRNRYRCMTSKERIWRKIETTFNTDIIKFIN